MGGPVRDPDFEAYFLESPGLFSVVSADGVFLRMNRVWADVLGWSTDEMVGHQFMEFVHPDDVEATRAVFARQAEGQAARGFENRYRCADGTFRWLLWSATPVNADGLVYAVAKDLTERKRLEAALRDSEARSRAVLDSAASAIITIDEAGTIQAFNRAAETIFGFAASEAVGRNVRMLMPADVAAEHDEYLHRYRETGETRVIGSGRDVVGRHKDGTEIPVHLAVTEVRLDDAERTYTGIVTDRREQIALRARETRALAEARRASEAKSAFLSRMSHELRTPLNAVIGYAQLLRDDVTAEDDRESVEMILAAGRHLLALINDILDLSRIEAGAFSLSLEPVDVDEVVTECVALVQPQADARGVRIVADDVEARVVQADRQRLLQVVLNLLSNAVKYNEDGGSVRIGTAPGPDGKLRVTVADSGPGIPEADRDRLFVPFARLGSDGASIEGTGLGLAVSAVLVEAMGGTIGVDSTPGVGSEFWVELAGGHEADGLADAAEPDGDLGRDATAPEGTVLYIEDNPANLRFFARVMERRPHLGLVTAPDAARGLARAVADRPDLVLLDLNLPDLSGQEVLARLRADDRTAGVPVVIVSADANPERVRRLLAAGATDYVTKPADVAQLLAVIDDVLGNPADPG